MVKPSRVSVRLDTRLPLCHCATSFEPMARVGMSAHLVSAYPACAFRRRFSHGQPSSVGASVIPPWFLSVLIRSTKVVRTKVGASVIPLSPGGAGGVPAAPRRRRRTRTALRALHHHPRGPPRRRAVTWDVTDSLRGTASPGGVWLRWARAQSALFRVPAQSTEGAQSAL